MKKLFKRFLLQTALVTVLLYVLWGLLLLMLPAEWLSPAIPVMIFFFALITASIYYLMLQSATNRFPRFVNGFMVLTLGKILLYSVLILIYVVLNPADRLPFIAAFFACYLVFTIFEVMAFLRDVREINRR